MKEYKNYLFIAAGLVLGMGIMWISSSLTATAQVIRETEIANDQGKAIKVEDTAQCWEYLYQTLTPGHYLKDLSGKFPMDALLKAHGGNKWELVGYYPLPPGAVGHNFMVLKKPTSCAVDR